MIKYSSTKWSPNLDKQMFTATIQGIKVSGVVRVIEDYPGFLWLCQNEKDGSWPPDCNLCGYTYSWVIDDDVEDLIIHDNVTKPWMYGEIK